MQACTHKIINITFVLTILYTNTIFFNKDKTLLNDNTFKYTPKSKQWSILKGLKKWYLLKLTKIEIYVNTNIKTRRHKCRNKSTHSTQQNKLHGTTHKHLAMSLIAIQANVGNTSAHTITFDTDAQPIGVDNRCTACISHQITDFIGTMRDTDRRIKGFGGTHTHPLKQGTLRWKWCDDEGKRHKFIIPNSYYAPEERLNS